MNLFYEITASKILSILLLLSPLNSLSQTNTKISETDPDTSSSKGSAHAFYTGLGYGNNFIYLGSTISQDQPFGYGSLTYGYKDELFASVSAVHLSGQHAFLAFYTGTISYNHVFNSWFDISSSISRYQVTTSLRDSLFNSFYYADITLGVDWKILYTKISAGVLFSDENNGYLQIRNSRYFQTPEFTKQKAYFSFDPYFSFLFGSMTKVETKEGKVVTKSPPYKKGGKYGNISNETAISTSFGFMELDFGLPVSFNTGKFTIEAEPGYILPVYDDPEYPGLKGFVFQLSGYLRIF